MSRNAKTAAVTKLCSKFQFLGKFLARAIMDFRILDIPFCQILYKWLLNQEGTLDLGDLAAVDPVLAQSLRQLQQVVQRKRQLEQDPSHTPDSRQLAVESLTLDGMPIEDLGLSFALPGYPEVELKVWCHKTWKDFKVIYQTQGRVCYQIYKHWKMGSKNEALSDHEPVTFESEGRRPNWEVLHLMSKPDSGNQWF